MFFGRSGPGTERRLQDSSSRPGIALQALSVLIVWLWRRPLFDPLGPVVFPVTAVILAAGSVWLSWTALKALGNQWSLVAGVTADHRLIQEGPYAVVRHPLYTCFFGLTLATALVWTEPAGLVVAVILFWVGVSIRVRSEEKILRAAFGREFEDYVRRVPAFFPLHIPGFGSEK